MRFLAFTAQFGQLEYHPLAPEIGGFHRNVRFEVLRGADTPDYFSMQPAGNLQQVLRDVPTLPVESLLNTGKVTFDFEKKRVFRDSFWKGSFTKDRCWNGKNLCATAVWAKRPSRPEGFSPGKFLEALRCGQERRR